MSTSEVSPETPLNKGQRAEAAIPTNVRVYLGLSGKTQKALGEALGITKSAMSMKMCGKVGWSVSDLVTTADFLGVTPSALMDDTILSKAEAGYAKSAEYGVFAEKPGALVGAGSPRFLVSPFNPDAPVEGGISGVAKGALAGFVPSGVPSGAGSLSMPSKHDGIGVSGRSQAHETLGAMTTVIMRMSHYYSEPKRVRFQSEGGKFIDADAIATAFAETTVLQDECEIQHLMGDIEDNREHRDPAKTPAVPIDELVRVTNERLATGNDEEQSRAWLFALFDQLDDIAEATKNNLEPLATALDTTLQNSSATIGNSATTDAGNSSNNANAGDARYRIISLIADALFPAAESSKTSESSASAAIRELMLNPTATSLDYMPAIDVLRAHGLAICR